MATKKQQTEITKQKIISASLKILSQEGSSGLTSGKLATATGISKGTIFHHYKDMEEIQLAVLEFLIDSIGSNMKAKEFRDLNHFMTTVISSTFSSFSQYRGVYAAWLQYSAETIRREDFRTKIQDKFRRTFKEWSPVLRTLVPPQTSDEKIDNGLRMIDMFFGGRCIHELIFNDPNRYRQISLEFIGMMKTYLGQSEARTVIA